MRTDQEILAAYETAEGNFRVGAKALGMTPQGFGLRCHKLHLSPTGKRQEVPVAAERAVTPPVVAPSKPEQCECGAWLPSFASVCHMCGKKGPGAHLLVALKTLGQRPKPGETRTEASRRVANMIAYWSGKASAAKAPAETREHTS